jgi:hypothetical protein
MNLEKFEEIITIYTYNGGVDKRPILLDIDKVVYFAPYITVNDNNDKVIDYTKANLINGESINLAIHFDELSKRFSI